MTTFARSFPSTAPTATDRATRAMPVRDPAGPRSLWGSLRSTCAWGAAVALLSASFPPLAAQAGMVGRLGVLQRPVAIGPMSTPGTESVLERFSGKKGTRPAAPLTALDGVLYGTTLSGGSDNKGTVFSITPARAARVVYSFQTGTDGSQPTSQLTVINGALYGETFTGGNAGFGTVFEVTTSGAERIVYSFKGGNDGANPESNLVDVDGVLYGTTTNGGSNGGGVIFALNPATGAESVLHTFGTPGTYQSDGSSPVGQLAVMDGTIYGSTLNGGLANCGMIFAFTASEPESVVYNFRGGVDGCLPTGGLTAVNGTLYGTTAASGQGNGTIFAATTTGRETVIYYFEGGMDGANPMASLIFHNGAFYGTTFNGGAHGKGTVFSLVVSGTLATEKILHAFSGAPDGANPQAGLLALDGLLYGTTNLGGDTSPQGTVYSIAP
jgi:uncharacterized repeat protein (TIGR03803 family)